MIAKLLASGSSVQFTFPKHSIVEQDDKIVLVDLEKLKDDDTVLLTFNPNLTPMDVTGEMFKKVYIEEKNGTLF